MTKITIYNVQRAVTPKVSKSQLWFLCSAHFLIVVNISVKFLENISNGFNVTAQTKIIIYNVQRTITPKGDKPQLRFLCSAPHFMVVNNSVTFCESVYNGFQV